MKIETNLSPSKSGRQATVVATIPKVSIMRNRAEDDAILDNRSNSDNSFDFLSSRASLRNL
jgi:hypothetical protein